MEMLPGSEKYIDRTHWHGSNMAYLFFDGNKKYIEKEKEKLFIWMKYG